MSERNNVSGRPAPGGAGLGGHSMAWVGPATPIGYFDGPSVPPGQRVVFADRSGNYSDTRGGVFAGRGRWSHYHLVDTRWHDLMIEDTCRSQSGALYFRVTVTAHWRISDACLFMQNYVEPEGYCRARVLVAISNQTKEFDPRETNVAQTRLDEFNATGRDVGNGLFVGLDRVVLMPPEGMDQLIGELDQGAAQFDVDRLRRIRTNADRLNDMDFGHAREGITMADARDRGEEWMKRAEEPVRYAELPRGRERPALPTGSPFDDDDDDVIDVAPVTERRPYQK
jgi:hypothetical protein